ncbi:2-succinyl-5-enolpyruvyl-6-hydroxy-3-cyclohexene-1-carboxylic-acid synthase [Ilumatobacter nonamiensis]|uniref:2-succinyl-5-enolpyruvyl-6-hydroxy-3- cyclohexene-1-carboxylic-acid synthase n=1 Tax=Ilumatobacter nonamiensis TaxID=467093 RepID=UPI0003477210|nr:2-succinyl-5-enolpyruvyl-6-hydroxy-3-cyclohexene-1-carboxylic-acid synthase [Ilumatobacter nonamiensis]
MVEVPAARELPADASPTDVQATYCATLVDQWLRLGVRHAIVAPGSRSTPMALALTDREEMAVHVVHDERAAAFVAVGLGLDAGPDRPATPALLLCTSGTAAANFFPAVVEAGLSEIPLIVLTADRPDELRGVGAPQTIDQIDLYGGHVRWSCDPGVAEASTAGEWRPLATTAWKHSAHGPVQLNLAFREPLVGRAYALPAPHDPEPVDHAPANVAPTDAVPSGFDRERGIILVGGRHGVDVDKIVELGRRTAWPIIADPTSGMRHLGDVSTVDALLRSEGFADTFAPDTIVRIGRPSTSKLLAQWTARLDATLIQVGGPGRIDPAHDVAARCTIDDLLAAAPSAATGRSWLDEWRRVDEIADQVMATHVIGDDLSEPAVARVIAENLPPAARLTVSSSMPVRDLEWFGGRTATAHSNRGANGIDGVLSTALGRALGRAHSSARPVGPEFVLIGDLAFVHDSNALVALTERAVDLRVVVVDNDGGGIFSFLPQATILEHRRFEQLFGTPLGTDVLQLAAAHGVPTATATSGAELIDQLGRPGPWLCRVPSDRAENVLVHQRLHDAVNAALDAAR